MRFPFCFLVLVLFSGTVISQSDTNYLELGLEFQQYPVGSIPGARLALQVAPRQALELRFGYNIAYHGDAGVHESEDGGGFGFSPGYQYWFRPNNQGLFLAARVDFWFNTIDWKDNIGLPNELSGTTEIMVVQPTLMGGCSLPLGPNFHLTPTLAFGAEINTRQEGEDVGEGAILLAGLQINYRIYSPVRQNPG